jgi:hypothetical protein
MADMKRDWLRPLVRIAESWFDDSVSKDEYARFLQVSIEYLQRAIQNSTESLSWNAEFWLALENIEKTSIHVAKNVQRSDDGAMALPALNQALAWFNETGEGGLIERGAVERFTALYLITILNHRDDQQAPAIESSVERLMRHVELRRKKCLQLRDDRRLSERWFELNDTAILMARSACSYGDLRYLNAALKLTDWALPVHRRSVPVDLLVRYVLAVSEVQSSFEVLV